MTSKKGKKGGSGTSLLATYVHGLGGEIYFSSQHMRHGMHSQFAITGEIIRQVNSAENPLEWLYGVINNFELPQLATPYPEDLESPYPKNLSGTGTIVKINLPLWPTSKVTSTHP